jgi:hypothetical protein
LEYDVWRGIKKKRIDFEERNQIGFGSMVTILTPDSEDIETVRYHVLKEFGIRFGASENKQHAGGVESVIGNEETTDSVYENKHAEIEVVVVRDNCLTFNDKDDVRQVILELTLTRKGHYESF